MCDLGRVALVVHQEQLEFPDVGDKELLETVREAVAGLLVATVADLRRAKSAKLEWRYLSEDAQRAWAVDP